MVVKALRIAPNNLALAAPSQYEGSTRTEILEQYVAILTGEVKVEGLRMGVLAEFHLASIVDVEELKRANENGLPHVVRSDDLKGTVEFNFRVVVAPRPDEDELLRCIYRAWGRHSTLPNGDSSLR